MVINAGEGPFRTEDNLCLWGVILDLDMCKLVGGAGELCFETGRELVSDGNDL